MTFVPFEYRINSIWASVSRSENKDKTFKDNTFYSRVRFVIIIPQIHGPYREGVAITRKTAKRHKNCKQKWKNQTRGIMIIDRSASTSRSVLVFVSENNSASSTTLVSYFPYCEQCLNLHYKYLKKFFYNVEFDHDSIFDVRLFESLWLVFLDKNFNKVRISYRFTFLKICSPLFYLRSLCFLLIEIEDQLFL